jgi:hypothetical protein
MGVDVTGDEQFLCGIVREDPGLTIEAIFATTSTWVESRRRIRESSAGLAGAQSRSKSSIAATGVAPLSFDCVNSRREGP